MGADAGGASGRWACLALPGDRTAGPVAREWVRRVVAEEPVDVDAVELVVAELVANAVLHAAPPVELRVGWSAGALLVEVTDGVGDLAAVGRSVPEDGGGRGLMIVSSLADRWGVRADGRGKVVWAELGLVLRE